jgi:uncharacterized membrane protein YgcG
MRIVRLIGAVLTILTVGLSLATPAGAQPPSKLADHITDNTGALTDSGRAAVSSAIDRLYQARHIQLWVVYVDNFNRFKPDNWADQTRSASGMGTNDVLLAVATNTKLYAFPGAPGLTADELTSLRTKQIEPAVATKDWSGAAVAAADGLNKSAAPAKKRNWVPIAIGVTVVVVVVVVLFLLYRARRRRRAARSSGQASIDGRDYSLEQALSTADSRLRQISDYAGRYHENIGAEAQSRLAEAKRFLAAAPGKEATNAREAIAYANGASRLAAQAQTLANADVLAAHGVRRRRGTTSAR